MYYEFLLGFFDRVPVVCLQGETIITPVLIKSVRRFIGFREYFDR